jgi:multidrug efflux pump subunit AcrA (membrane-fusion protein)
MRQAQWAAVILGACTLITTAALVGLRGMKSDNVRAAEPVKRAAEEAVSGPLEVIGRTQPVPGHVARIAPVPMHPVEEIKVSVGDRVKKDQDLIKLDSDEPQADVRAKKAILAEMEASLARLKEEPREEDEKEARANLENARVSLRETKELLERLEPAYRSGALPEQRYIEVRALVVRCQADERAAQARLDKLLRRPFKREIAEIEARIATARGNLEAAEAELEHYLLKSPIDGVVASLTAVIGDVRGHETTIWGEIIDIKQLDVRCDVPPSQLDAIRLGDRADVRVNGRAGAGLTGKVVNIGIAADRTTGNVPVLVRVENPDEKLRCYIQVVVRFDSQAKGAEK